jgi:hypothetical protein
VNLGFQPAETITMALFLGIRTPEARVAVVDRILDRVESLPGVKAASTIQSQRTHEIGIPLALGAAHRQIFLDVFERGARLVAAVSSSA